MTDMERRVTDERIPAYVKDEQCEGAMLVFATQRGGRVISTI